LIGAFRNTQEVAVNKSELVESVVKTTGMAKRDVENVVNATVHTIVSEVKGGRRVAIVGFGAFRPTRRAARMGRNPQTGAAVRISASKGVSFGASSLFKEILNGKAPLGAPKLTGPSALAARSSASKAPAKRGGATKAVAKKAPTKRATATKAVAKKAPTKRATATKAVVKKAPARRQASVRVAARAPRAPRR